MSDVRHRLLALHFDDVTCAISTSDLVAIDHDGASSRISIDGPLRDLADYLPHCSSSAPPMRLILDDAGSRKAFRARARLELVETTLLYRMPRVMRDCGCASWLRGIALLDQWSSDNTAADGKRLALWLDLAGLADACDRTPTNQKEMLR
jgi:hypothetical protein